MKPRSKIIYIFVFLALFCGASYAQQISVIPVGKLVSDLDRVTSIGFSANSEFVLAGDRKGNLQLWDINNLQAIGTAKVKYAIVLIEFLRNDNEILVIDEVGNLHFYGTNKLNFIRSDKLSQAPVELSLDPEKRLLSYISKDGKLRTYNLKANMLQSSISINDRIKKSLYLGYDRFGQQLVAMSTDGTTLICNPNVQKVIRESKLRSNEFSGSSSVMHAAASNKGSDLFVTGVQEVFIPKGGLKQGQQPERRNSILAYDWDTSNEVKRIRVNNRVDEIVLGPGPVMITYFTKKKNKVSIVDIDQGAEVSEITVDELPEKIIISSDDAYLGVGDKNGTVHLYTIEKNAAPEIKIISPSLKRNIGESIIQEDQIDIQGALSDGAKIKKITVNGQPAEIQPNGKFISNIGLIPGKNKVRIIAEDYQSNTVFKDIYITRNPKIEVPSEHKSIAIRKKKALVIGNANYEGTGQLINTLNDASLITEILEGLNFEVTTVLDGTYEEMKNAIFEYGDNIRDIDISLFFFAGHGIEIEGVNYLVPIDANISSALAVKQRSIPLTGILRTISYSNENGLNMIILDACRNNPFPTGNRGGAGLAEETPASGTLIAYSTSPGNVASDGSGSNGLYTGELAKQLIKSQRIEDVFMNTRISVEELSNGSQQPWEEARLKGVFYLKYD